MKTLKYTMLLALAFICFYGAYRAHCALMPLRTLQRSAYSAPIEDAPPLMAFTTVALGGFRGIIADILWLRGMELQQQGRFFELAQLADWITKLEPHFVNVWAFHAWNMAYNISNIFPDPDDRWRWIQRGVQLIRDEGLRLNPHHPLLHWELAWLYQHKIGYVMDGSHRYYKIRLAKEIDELLDGRAPDYDAPADDPGLTRLREDYKLLPEVMLEIERQYGPLDWRLAASHALYWAYRGRELAVRHSDAFKCERTIAQCMEQSFRQGNLFFNPEVGIFITSPDPVFLPFVLACYEDALQRHDAPALHIGYAGFLAESVLILYCYGWIEQASELFDFLIERYPAPDEDIPFDVFVGNSLDPTSLDSDLAMALVEGLLFQAIAQRAAGNEERAGELEQRAETAWNKYMDSRASEDHRRRTGLPPLSLIRERAAARASATGESGS